MTRPSLPQPCFLSIWIRMSSKVIPCSGSFDFLSGAGLNEHSAMAAAKALSEQQRPSGLVSAQRHFGTEPFISFITFAQRVDRSLSAAAIAWALVTPAQ